MKNADLVIDVQGMTKRFGGRAVVNDIAMQVRRGEIYGFLGPNGSGKTTFLRMLCGLLRPDGGNGTCLGFDIRTDAAEIKKRVGYMTQRFSFYEDLTIEENLDFVARIYGVANRKAAVAKGLETLGMTARRRQLAGQLSGGWKQRLALAACMIHGPELLLLDEPTAGVDPKARRDFWDEIHRLAASGLTVLITTHYMDEAERCHSLAYIAYGNLLTRGTVGEVVKAGNLKSTQAGALKDAATLLSEELSKRVFMPRAINRQDSPTGKRKWVARQRPIGVDIKDQETARVTLGPHWTPARTRAIKGVLGGQTALLARPGLIVARSKGKRITWMQAPRLLAWAMRPDRQQFMRHTLFLEDAAALRRLERAPAVGRAAPKIYAIWREQVKRGLRS